MPNPSLLTRTASIVALLLSGQIAHAQPLTEPYDSRGLSESETHILIILALLLAALGCTLLTRTHAYGTDESRVRLPAGHVPESV